MRRKLPKSKQMKSDILINAEKYISNKWHIFPLPHRSKVPARGFLWKNEATLNCEKAQNWFNNGNGSEHNIAIQTGRVSNLIVVDSDGDSGAKSIKAIGRIPDTFTVKTAGGRHYYYQYPEGQNINNTMGLGEYGGIDIRSNGGYVVAPPSLHPDGKTYEVEKDVALAELPESIVRLYNNRPAGKKRGKSKEPDNQNKRWKEKGWFVLTPNETLAGMARSKLSAPQMAIYTYMRGRCGKRDGGRYLTKTTFECPYSFIKEDLGYYCKTINVAIHSLQAKGFIKLIRQGGSKNSKKWTSIYSLCDDWCK